MLCVVEVIHAVSSWFLDWMEGVESGFLLPFRGSTCWRRTDKMSTLFRNALPGFSPLQFLSFVVAILSLSINWISIVARPPWELLPMSRWNSAVFSFSDGAFGSVIFSFIGFGVVAVRINLL